MENEPITKSEFDFLCWALHERLGLLEDGFGSLWTGSIEAERELTDRVLEKFSAGEG